MTYYFYSNEQVYFIKTKPPHPIKEKFAMLLLLLTREPTFLVARKQKEAEENKSTIKDSK